MRTGPMAAGTILALATFCGCADAPAGPTRVDLAVPTRSLGSLSEVQVTAWVPAGSPNAMIVFLHGVGGSQDTWADLGGNEALVTALAEPGAKAAGVRPLILAVRGDSTGWPDHRDGSVSWSRFLLEELPPFAMDRFGEAPRDLPVAFLGTSAGGSQALTMALREPGRIRCVAAHSPAVHPADPDHLPDWARDWEGWRPLYGLPIDAGAWRASNPIHLAGAVQPAALQGVGLYFDAGTEDHLGFDQTAADLSTAMEARGIAHEFVLRPGGHGDAYTAANLHHSLGFLLSCLGDLQPVTAVQATGGGSRRFDRSVLLEETSETSANVGIGDLDGDGHLDLVLVKGRHWPLLDPVLLGDGSGAFSLAPPLGGEADRSYSGVVVDMDRDGDLDVVVSNDDPDPKRVYLNDGTARFEVGSTFGRPEWPTRHVSVADLNGDTFPDAVLANRTGGDSGANFVCFGTGDGRFEEECVGFSHESATTVTPADFDGDGDLDLAVPHRDGGQSRIYLNDGRGGFANHVPFGPADATIRAAKAADFDGDGKLDLAIIDQRLGPAILRGREDLEFEPPSPLGGPGPTPYAIAVADLDGNGRPDIIVGYVEAAPVAHFNDGPGAFTPVAFGDDQGVAYGFGVADFDEDGFLDIAMARSGAPNVLYFGSAATAARR